MPLHAHGLRSTQPTFAFYLSRSVQSRLRRAGARRAYAAEEAFRLLPACARQARLLVAGKLRALGGSEMRNKNEAC